MTSNQEHRQKWLDHLYNLILSGKYDGDTSYPGEYFGTGDSKSNRPEYIPPYDRDNLNWGYTTAPELGAEFNTGFADDQELPIKGH